MYYSHPSLLYRIQINCFSFHHTLGPHLWFSQPEENDGNKKYSTNFLLLNSSNYKYLLPIDFTFSHFHLNIIQPSHSKLNVLPPFFIFTEYIFPFVLLLSSLWVLCVCVAFYNFSSPHFIYFISYQKHNYYQFINFQFKMFKSNIIIGRMVGEERILCTHM